MTFAGARHQLVLLMSGTGAGEAARCFAERLEAAEFRLRGHILADIVLVAMETIAGGMRLRLEALTVEE